MPLTNQVVSPAAGAFSNFQNLTDSASATGINMLIFGGPGVGKTTLAVDAQKSEIGGQTVLVDADHGRESVLDVEGVQFFVPETWKEIRATLDTALTLKEDSPIKTWVWDSVSAIYYKLLVPSITKSQTAQLTQPQYFEAQRLLTKFVDDTVTLTEYGINTLFIGHTKEESDGDIVNIRFGLPQGIRNEILQSVNHVGYLARDKKDPSKRVLYFEPPRRVEGPKVRQTRTGFKMDLAQENPSMDTIFNQLRRSK